HELNALFSAAENERLVRDGAAGLQVLVPGVDHHLAGVRVGQHFRIGGPVLERYNVAALRTCPSRPSPDQIQAPPREHGPGNYPNDNLLHLRPSAKLSTPRSRYIARIGSPLTSIAACALVASLVVLVPTHPLDVVPRRRLVAEIALIDSCVRFARHLHRDHVEV